jgi:hypothetical protein
MTGPPVEVIASPPVACREADELATGEWQPGPRGELADLARQLAVIVAVRERRWGFGRRRMREFGRHTRFMPENGMADNQWFSKFYIFPKMAEDCHFCLFERCLFGATVSESSFFALLIMG